MIEFYNAGISVFEKIGEREKNERKRTFNYRNGNEVICD